MKNKRSTIGTWLHNRAHNHTGAREEKDLPIPMEDWSEFYLWLSDNGCIVGGEYGYDILKNNIIITTFDPQECADSGEIQETINRILEYEQETTKGKRKRL